ncbi:desiccation-related protein PCC13-62-like [Selaginella moellendorffii]|uniref:desiccation-related protein PCC13-62-like n=1 Tax=Selaginella moellendorffii TaxID=88036 RepID=UPI000D1C9DB4|nr:desiccation-related protein PCC13-62-like [Selaginella moellendorffii]|eukprot:XP_024521274.1 desiccation-related protein PCC13-62-like [Selaginella moellendorffii]
MTRSSLLVLLFAAALLVAGSSPPTVSTWEGCLVSQNASYIPFGIPEADAEGLQLALNVEYLEAEFFLWSAFGHGLDVIIPGLSGGGSPPVGAQLANLDEFTRDLSAQFGYQEIGHLRAIKDTLGSAAFRRPVLDLSSANWAAFFDRALGGSLNPPFDVYANSLNFLLASYMIPYIGLTGYVGGNTNLQSSTAKRLVAGLLGVESGQDAVIRAYLTEHAERIVSPYSFTVAEVTARLSNFRSTIDHSYGVNDEGIHVPLCLGAEGRTTQNTLVGDDYSVSYSRTPAQVLSIVYRTGNPSCPGGFFPLGALGTIATSFLSEGCGQA